MIHREDLFSMDCSLVAQFYKKRSSFLLFIYLHKIFYTLEMLKKAETQQLMEVVFDKYYLSAITDEWTNLLDEYRDYASKLCDEEIEKIIDDAEGSKIKKEVLEYRKHRLQNASYQDLHNDYHMKVTANLDSYVTEDGESAFDYKAFFKLILGELR